MSETKPSIEDIEADIYGFDLEPSGEIRRATDEERLAAMERALDEPLRSEFARLREENATLRAKLIRSLQSILDADSGGEG